MNQAQRKIVADKLQELIGLKEQVEAIGSELRTLAEEEQEKYDNMPEGLQGGDKGQAIETAAQALDEAASAAENGECAEAINALENVE